MAIPFSDGVWYDPKDRLYKMWYMAGYGVSCTCYAESRDGIRWVKPELDALPGTNIVQSVGGGCLIVGDELHFCVSGRNTRDLNRCEGDARKTAYISTGLATLRRDGFASMDAGPDGGTLIMRKVRFSGKHLFVNVACPEGELSAEVLDNKGNAIAPFSKENCAPIK